MNYLNLVKTTKQLIEEKLDNIHTFEFVEKEYINELFKKDDMEITYHSLELIRNDNVDQAWFDYYGKEYDNEQGILAEFVYNRIIKSDWFEEALYDAVSNYYYDLNNV